MLFLSLIFQSRFFHPCYFIFFGAAFSTPTISIRAFLVPIIPVSHFPPLQFGSEFSNPAFSFPDFSASPLKLNPTKTELIWFGSARRLPKCSFGPIHVGAD